MNYEKTRQMEENAQSDKARAQEVERLLQERATLARDFEILDRLSNNTDLQWFIQKHLAPMVQEQFEGALDTAKPAEAMKYCAHRWHMGIDMLGALKLELSKTQSRLNALNEPARRTP